MAAVRSELVSLSEALKSGTLASFISQEEARGVGPIDKADFDAAAPVMIICPSARP
jgi:hypothetical protein